LTISNHPEPHATLIEIDDALFSVLSHIADTGVLGKTAEEVVNHILRKWIWDEQGALDELDIDAAHIIRQMNKRRAT